MNDQPLVNHEEALQLAHIRKEESNLARCYIELKAMYDKVFTALESANSLCRSSYQVAIRSGIDTNWDALAPRLSESLLVQHEVLYPSDNAPQPFKSVGPRSLALISEGDLAVLKHTLLKLQDEEKRLRRACSTTEDEVQQILGKALDYPWFKDDQANFPGATEANGVCIGDHVAATLAMEAARKIADLEEHIAMMADEIRKMRG